MREVLRTYYDLDDIKEEAINENRHINVENIDWFDSVFDDWQTRLEEIGFTDAKIHFSGFWNQGDGASFDADIDNDLVVAHLVKMGRISETEAESILKLQDSFELKIRRNSYANHYSHKRTRYVNIEYWDMDNEEQEIRVERFAEQVELLRLELSDDIYSDLNKDYDYLTCDDAVYDTLKANNYYFESNGKIAGIIEEI
jgi:hypothetical protein